MSTENTQKVYRVGIVGLGRMGSTIDLEFPDWPPYSVAAACDASPRLEIAAGADIDAEKRKAFTERWGVQAVYSDYLEMIEKEAPDIVAICTRGPLHAEMTVRTAEAGVPMIFCEKAMAGSMEEADKVLETLNQRAVLFNTGVLRRFDRRYKPVRDLIESGALGNVTAVVHYARSTLLHGHIHSMDTISYLLGDPRIDSVWGELRPSTLAPEGNRFNSDPVAIYHLVFSNGVEATSVSAGTWEFEVIGSEGSVRMLNNGEGAVIRRAVRRGKLRHFEEEALEIPPRDSATQSCLEDLVEAYETGRPTLGHVNVAHHITEACLAVAESHITGQRVHLPLANRSLYVEHV